MIPPGSRVPWILWMAGATVSTARFSAWLLWSTWTDLTQPRITGVILSGRDDEVVVQNHNAILVRAALIYRAEQFRELMGDPHAVSAAELVAALRSSAQQHLPDLQNCFPWLDSS